MIKKLSFLPVLAICGAFSLSAGTFTFGTPAGSTTSGGAVNAQATFVTGAGTVGITLTDLLANPTDVAQLISDLFFQVNNGGVPITTGGTLTSSSGQQINVASDGTAMTTTTGATGYLLSNSGATFHLNDLNGGAGPTHLIIGPPGPMGVYSNANGSIAGNDPHNPFLNQTATFNLMVTGASATSTISNVVFSFGTTSGINVAGVQTPTPVPEPTSLLLLGTLVAALGYGRLQARRKA